MGINVNFIKGATELVTSCCGSYVAGAIVGSLCPVSNPIAKVAVVIGGGAIGGMVGDAAGKYMANTIGDICEILDVTKQNV